MENFKILFKEDGSSEIINNYIPNDEEINELKAYDAAKKKEEKEEKENVDESEMSIEEIRAWTFAKTRGESYEEFSQHWKKPSTPSSSLKSTSKKHSRRGKRSGRQISRLNTRGKDSVARSYLIELENIQRLEEIKVLYFHNEYIQYNEIINDAIEFYYKKITKAGK